MPPSTSASPGDIQNKARPEPAFFSWSTNGYETRKTQKNTTAQTIEISISTEINHVVKNSFLFFFSGMLRYINQYNLYMINVYLSLPHDGDSIQNSV